MEVSQKQPNLNTETKKTPPQKVSLPKEPKVELPFDIEKAK